MVWEKRGRREGGKEGRREGGREGREGVEGVLGPYLRLKGPQGESVERKTNGKGKEMKKNCEMNEKVCVTDQI